MCIVPGRDEQDSHKKFMSWVDAVVSTILPPICKVTYVLYVDESTIKGYYQAIIYPCHCYSSHNFLHALYGAVVLTHPNEIYCEHL